MKPFDLHCHTTRSDGSMTAEEVVQYAAYIGLQGVAITDHDTLPDLGHLMLLENRYGVRVIPGVEISTRHQGQPVHLLCYLLQQPEILQEMLHKTQEGRRISKLKIVHKLMEDYPITEEMVVHNAKDCASIFEPHVMKAIADLGYTNTPMGPILKRIVSGGDCFVKNESYPDTFDALQIIKLAGGVCGIAHPGQFNSVEIVKLAAAQGLIQAVEVEHYANTEEHKAQLGAIAKEFELIRTGGSDFHGANARTPRVLGLHGCSADSVQKLEMLTAQ